MTKRLNEDDLNRLEKTWQDYLTDDLYNDIGKLNLVAWLGEKSGLMLAEIRALQVELKAARVALDVEKTSCFCCRENGCQPGCRCNKDNDDD